MVSYYTQCVLYTKEAVQLKTFRSGVYNPLKSDLWLGAF